MSQNDSGAPVLLPPGRLASLVETRVSRLADDEMVFFSIPEIAILTDRKVKTIVSWLSRFQLPRRRSFVVRRGHRQAVVTVRRDVVRWLVEAVLHADEEALKRPPGRRDG